MRILAIESSCDETGVAIYDTQQRCLLANELASQIDAHACFGGVVPELASREHCRILPRMVDAAMQQAAIDWQALDAVAVTSGPGLMGALLVGSSYARAAATVHGLPLLPVHHLEGHILAFGLQENLPPMPMIALLVSGGHTLLVRVDGIGRYRLLGQTLDDAAGECFDKSARLLGLPYPGGPQLSALARQGHAGRFTLPRPMLRKDNLDFSFSGLKTAVLHAANTLDKHDTQGHADLAREVETAICEVLVNKTLRACQQEKIAHVVLAGGVAANQQLRQHLQQQASRQDIACYLPALSYCTDNAAMIAYAAACRLQAGLDRQSKDWDANPRQSLFQN